MPMKVAKPALSSRCIRRIVDDWDIDVTPECEAAQRLDAEQAVAIATVRAQMGCGAAPPHKTTSVRAPGAVAGQ